MKRFNKTLSKPTDAAIFQFDLTFKKSRMKAIALPNKLISSLMGPNGLMTI